MTANYINTGPTLDLIGNTDTVVYGKGSSAVSSVGTATVTGDLISISVTLADGTVFTATSSNTVLSSWHIDQAGTRHATWVYSN